MPINKHCILVLPRARSSLVLFCLLRKNKIKHNATITKPINKHKVQFVISPNFN